MLHVRYPGWVAEAVGVALIAMVASLVVLSVPGALGVTAFEAVGVPGA